MSQPSPLVRPHSSQTCREAAPQIHGTPAGVRLAEGSRLRMTFWNGTGWVDEPADATAPPQRKQWPRRLVSTGLIVVVITALLVPTIGASANGLPGHRLRETWSEHYIVRTIQEADARIAYSGAWARASFRDYLGGSARYSDRAGSKATLRFSGTAIAWIGPKGPTRGRANVYLNGRLVETVNTYASRFRPAQILFQATFSKPAIRTLSVVVLGTHQHPTVAVDAFIVRGVKRPQATAESTPAPMPPRATE